MEMQNETVASKMGTLTGDLKHSDGVDCAYGSYGTFVVVVGFQFINWILKMVGPPKSLRDDEWKWRNLAISWLHALICIFWILYSWISEPQQFQDLQYYRSYNILFLITFSSGYFLYDFLDLALNGKMFAMWEVQLHHVAVGGMFYYNLVNCEWIAFNTIALSVEINSFFLHSRKLLQMVRTSFDSPLYRVTIFLNITTFVVFRSIPFALILWAIYSWAHRVALTYLVCLCAAMFVMIVMNPILFMRLLRSDYMRKPKRAEAGAESKGKAVVNGNNNNHLANGNHLKVS